jgi:RNA polymerase-binding transcription factor DksA
MNNVDSINELAWVKEELEYQLAVARQRISVLKHRSRPEGWQGGGDNTPLSEDVEASQALEARDYESEQGAWLFERAAGLEHALRRIQDGSYGTCERCDRSIDRNRLHALPEARYCVNCAEQLGASAVANIARTMPRGWKEPPASSRSTDRERGAQSRSDEPGPETRRVCRIAR